MSLIKSTTLLITLIISLFTTALFAATTIAERIAPIGDVYLDGEIITASSTAVISEPSGPRSGEDIYNTYCVACHATGVAGAPIKGDAVAWAPRIATGEELLVQHAMQGINAMPAKGTCADCSDEEIAATVAFLIQGM